MERSVNGRVVLEKRAQRSVNRGKLNTKRWKKKLIIGSCHIITSLSSIWGLSKLCALWSSYTHTQTLGLTLLQSPHSVWFERFVGVWQSVTPCIPKLKVRYWYNPHTIVLQSLREHVYRAYETAYTRRSSCGVIHHGRLWRGCHDAYSRCIII